MSTRRVNNVTFERNQHFGTQEMNLLMDMIREGGTMASMLASIKSYGIIFDKNDTLRESFRVIEGTTNGTDVSVEIKAGLALDSQHRLIEATSDDEGVDVLTITATGVAEYIHVRHADKLTIGGTVAVTTAGLLTGTGTEFTRYLRAAVNFPMKVRFPDSTGNTSEYIVKAVNSDTSAEIFVPQGTALAAESGQTIELVGSFNIGEAVLPSAKNAIRFGGFEVFTSASISTDPDEFVLAKVVNTAGTMTIEDYRFRNVFAMTAEESLGSKKTSTFPTAARNSIVGILAETHHPDRSLTQTNMYLLGWGMMCDNTMWSYDDATRKLSITTCLPAGTIDPYVAAGTQFNFFDESQMVGWRVYTEDSAGHARYAKVLSAARGGSFVIELTLDGGELGSTSSSLTVVPDADFIAFRMTIENRKVMDILESDASMRTEAIYPISHGSAWMEMYTNYQRYVNSDGIICEYRYITGGMEGDWYNINTGSYYNAIEWDYSENKVILGTKSGVVSIPDTEAEFIPKRKIDSGGIEERYLPADSILLSPAFDDLSWSTNDMCVEKSGEAVFLTIKASISIGGSIGSISAALNLPSRFHPDVPKRFAINLTGGMETYWGYIETNGNLFIPTITNATGSIQTLIIDTSYKSVGDPIPAA